MSEGRKAIPHPNASEFEIKKYDNEIAKEGIRKFLGNTEEKKPEKHMGFDKNEFIDLYKEKEIPIARKQRELLGLTVEEFIVLKNYSQLPEDEREQEMPKIVDSYKRNAKRGMELKHQWINGEISSFNKKNGDNIPEFTVRDWVELMGFIPLYSDGDKMVKKYEERESKLIDTVRNKLKKGEEVKVSYKKIAYFEEIKDNLNLTTEEFLDKLGLLPKQEQETKPDIIA